MPQTLHHYYQKIFIYCSHTFHYYYCCCINCCSSVFVVLKHCVYCQVILITDGCSGIGEGSLSHAFSAASLPRYGFRLHVACITDTKDPSFSRSEPLYRRLVSDTAVSGEVFVPEGSLCEQSVQQMFLTICDKHYVPFTGTLRCGNLQCPVYIFPAPENYSRLVGCFCCIITISLSDLPSLSRTRIRFPELSDFVFF